MKLTLIGVLAMEKCCKLNEQERRDFFWDFFFKNEKTFTTEQVKVLIDKVKEFNAGAIDAYLTNHVDRCFNEWAENLK